MKFYWVLLLLNYVDHRLLEDMHQREKVTGHDVYITNSTHRRCCNRRAISSCDQIKSGRKIYKPPCTEIDITGCFLAIVLGDKYRHNVAEH